MVKLTVEFDENQCTASIEGGADMTDDGIVMGIGVGVGKAIVQALFCDGRLPCNSINLKGVQTTLIEYIQVGMAEEFAPLMEE